MTEHDSRTYLSFSANLGRIMRMLGLKGAPLVEPTLADLLAGIAPAQPHGEALDAVQEDGGADAPDDAPAAQVAP